MNGGIIVKKRMTIRRLIGLIIVLYEDKHLFLNARIGRELMCSPHTWLPTHVFWMQCTQVWAYFRLLRNLYNSPPEHAICSFCFGSWFSLSIFLLQESSLISTSFQIWNSNFPVVENHSKGSMGCYYDRFKTSTPWLYWPAAYVALATGKVKII